MANQRISEALRSIGELYEEIADELAASDDDHHHDDARGERAHERPSALRALIDAFRQHQRALREFLHDEPTTGAPARLFQSTAQEQAMAIMRRDFAHSYVRLAIKGEEIAVEAGHGFERKAHFADKLPTTKPGCDDNYGIKPIASATSPATSWPRNTRVVRLRLAADHQVDPDSSVLIATPVGRESAFRFHTQAFGVDDRTIDLAIRVIDADLNQPTTPLARFHVLVLRVAD